MASTSEIHAVWLGGKEKVRRTREKKKYIKTHPNQLCFIDEDAGAGMTYAVSSYRVPERRRAVCRNCVGRIICKRNLRQVLDE